MSVNYDVLGLIFASMHDNTVAELTKQRTMGSMLYGGRYRLIDFPLSNMVNSGIPEVGVITKSNYGSLLDHLGSGRGREKGQSLPGNPFADKSYLKNDGSFFVVVEICLFQACFIFMV